jgi:hypothetical protein
MVFGFIYILDFVLSLEAANHTVCSNNVMYIESVRDKQNEYGDTVSTLVDPNIHRMSSLPRI